MALVFSLRFILFFVILIFTKILLSRQTHLSSSYGQDFYVGFMRTTAGSQSALLRLIVGTPSPSASFTAENSSHIIYQGTVTSGAPIVITVSSGHQVTGTDFSNRQKGIRVYSNGTEPIFVVVETILSNLNYGTYLAYPFEAFTSLTKYEYVILSQEGSSASLRSIFLLVATFDDTSVTITPSQMINLPANAQSSSISVMISPNTESHELTLNRRQTLLVESENDLTGSIVISNKPLTVISGHECANVPVSESGCEPLAIQLPLKATWGTKFLLAPFAGRNSAQVFKAANSNSTTSFVYTCENVTTTSATTGDFFQFSTDKYCYLESSSPILLAQLSVGESLDSLGDPAIAMVSPIDQYVHEIQFISLPTNDFPNSYVSITVPDNPSGVLFNGDTLTCEWQTLYDSGGSIVGYGCSVAISGQASVPTQHTISHSSPGGMLSVLVYGFNTSPFYGYAYLAGQSITLSAGTLQSTTSVTTIIPESPMTTEALDLTAITPMNAVPTTTSEILMTTDVSELEILMTTAAPTTTDTLMETATVKIISPTSVLAPTTTNTLVITSSASIKATTFVTTLPPIFDNPSSTAPPSTVVNPMSTDSIDLLISTMLVSTNTVLTTVTAVAHTVQITPSSTTTEIPGLSSTVTLSTSVMETLESTSTVATDTAQLSLVTTSTFTTAEIPMTAALTLMTMGAPSPSENPTIVSVLAPTSTHNPTSIATFETTINPLTTPTSTPMDTPVTTAASLTIPSTLSSMALDSPTIAVFPVNISMTATLNITHILVAVTSTNNLMTSEDRPLTTVRSTPVTATNTPTTSAVTDATTTSQVSTIPKIRCESETVETDSGITYVWPATAPGFSANFSCPLDSNVVVSRACGSAGWELFDEDACGDSDEVNNQLDTIFNNLTTENYATAVSVVSQVIMQSANDTSEQTSATLMAVTDYLLDLSMFIEISDVQINETVIDDVVAVVSSLVQWDPANINVDNSSHIIQSFEVVVSLFAEQLQENETLTFSAPMITLVAELRSVESLQQTGRSFSIGATASDVLPPEQSAAIDLPASLFRNIDNRSFVGLFFALYDDSTLFPVGNTSRNDEGLLQTRVGSPVLATTVGPGITFENLEENVTVTLRAFEVQESIRCVTWNFTLNDWTTEGCTTRESSDQDVILCSCNHLTNFALLVDICLRQDGCEPFDPGFSLALTSISYIGIIISIISLILTITTMLLFKKIRQKVVSKYHIQLSLAILLMLTVALVLIILSAEGVDTLYGGCVMVSVLVHYFTLVAVMWMGAESLLMFQKLIIVFTQVTTRFVIAVSVICWTVPLVIVAIPLIIDLASNPDPANDIVVHRPLHSNDTAYCFLSNTGAFWGSFMAPFLAVMVFNVVIFIWIIVVLIRHTKGKAARRNESVDKKTVVRLMISISGIMFLFGITWFFAILTFSVSGIREVGSILFTVFNSLQGLFIFIFFCAASKEARESWREFFSCGKYKSLFLHPSLVKYNLSGGMSKTSTMKSDSSTLPRTPTSPKSSDYETSTLPIKNKCFDDINLASQNSQAKFVDAEVSCMDESKSAEPEEIKMIGVAAKEIDTSGSSKEVAVTTTNTKNVEPLKIRVKRNSSLKYGNHDIEVMEVDFYSSGSGEDDNGSDNTRLDTVF